jgi:hypothetical protein
MIVLVHNFNLHRYGSLLARRHVRFEVRLERKGRIMIATGLDHELILPGERLCLARKSHFLVS